MSEKHFITKCCICGRQKTESGWMFRPDPPAKEAVFSHGFCASCYETELMKIKLMACARAQAVSA